jgi:succinate dehydrogenase / fumarate reductase cytochrome b subunit
MRPAPSPSARTATAADATPADLPNAGAQALAAAVSAPAAARWIARAGLALVLFLVVHLLIVALAWLQPPVFEAAAAALHAQPWLPLAELLLAAAALTHPLLALTRTLANRAAGNSAPLRSRRGDPLAALAARSAPFSGLVLALFLVVHLAQLRWARPQSGAELAALLAALQTPAAQVLYGAAALALGLHLVHGTEAAHRSLGLLDPGNALPIRRAGRALALLLAGGFLLLPPLLLWLPLSSF